MIISASQLIKFLSCPRQWWFERRAKLPTPNYSGSFGQNFGSALHSVAERYLLSPSTTGAEDPRLYPEGWMDEWKDELTELDGEHIKALISKAVEEGLLYHAPDALVEERVGAMVIPADRPGGEHVYLTGFVDWALPHSNTIRDHKTCKSFRYALSREKLSANLQLLVYAFLLGSRWRLAEEDTIRLEHIYYCSTPGENGEPLVRPTKGGPAEVTMREARDHWETVVVPAAREMLALDMKQETYQTPEGVERSWFDVSAAWGKSWEACNAYGGCAFLDICGESESIPHYLERVKRLKNPEAYSPLRTLPSVKFPQPSFKISEAPNNGQTYTEGTP